MCGMDRGDSGGAEYLDPAKQAAWGLYWFACYHNAHRLHGRDYAAFADRARRQFEDEWAARDKLARTESRQKPNEIGRK